MLLLLGEIRFPTGHFVVFFMFEGFTLGGVLYLCSNYYILLFKALLLICMESCNFFLLKFNTRVTLNNCD